MTASPGGAATPADPAEGVNRVGFAIHQTLDRFLLRPAALAFKAITPPPLRKGLENLLSNLGEPVVAANDLLQGRFHKAGDSTLRFVVNSTVGVAGLFDVATPAGLPYHGNGFALTLGRAGVAPGPYLFIPLLGPTTVRDLIGEGVDVISDPFRYFVPHATQTVIVGKGVVSGLDARANADADLTALMSDATDPYATLRSVYLQNQQSKIDDTAGSSLPPLPDFDEDSTAPAAAPPVSETVPTATPPTASPTSAPAAASSPLSPAPPADSAAPKPAG
jgi:phospholipid-binding lipoprotein MlaA